MSPPHPKKEKVGKMGKGTITFPNNSIINHLFQHFKKICTYATDM